MVSDLNFYCDDLSTAVVVHLENDESDRSVLVAACKVFSMYANMCRSSLACHHA